MCSSKVGGTPTGTAISAGATVDAFIAICSRRSISRTSCRVFVEAPRSDALNLTRSRDRLSVSESRMLRSRCAARGALLGRAAVAEQPLEHDLRVQLHRQRLASAIAHEIVLV